MKPTVRTLAVIVVGGALLQGCAAPNVDFSSIKRPERSAELDKYNIFVGSWDWEAEMLNTDDANKDWKGTAQWRWTLDKRCLHGTMSAKNATTEFETAGIWSWHPGKKKYVWWMFNNWGYPQEGTAAYDEANKSWEMKYKSIGLDGTSSYGTYRMTIVDNDTLKWCNVEYADALRTVKKIEMRGTYKRRK